MKSDRLPPTAPPSEVQIPHPPRFWWTKRIALLVLFAVVAVPVLRWWWGREADRRRAAIFADAKVRGEPILPEEFEPKRVPDADNAAILFEQAAAAMKSNRQLDRLDVPEQFSPLTFAQLQAVGAALNANRRPLKLARQATTRPSASWGYKQQDASTIKSFRRGQVPLSRLLEWAALYDHARGDDREATALVQDLVHQSRVFDTGPPTLLTRLISINIQMKAIELIHRFSRELRLEDAASAASRAQMLDLIRLLLDDVDQHSLDVRAYFDWRAELVSWFGKVEPQYKGEPEWLLAPMYNLDVVHLAAWVGMKARAAESTDWPTASARLPPDPPFSGSHLFNMARLESNISEHPTALDLDRWYKIEVERHVAAIELAIRLYRFDHGGKYPATLNELVPTHLPFVPVDAMASNGRPISYRPDAHPPLLYSVGDNGKDDGGVGTSRWSPWCSPDAVFLLEEPPQEAIQPSRQAHDHQRKQHNEAGQPATQSKHHHQ
jgi:hypothetical protein